MLDPLITMALVAGFLGSGHCIGMCGGIVAALSLSGDGRRGGLPFHLLYNIGRMGTYSLIGLLVGWLGSAIVYTESFRVGARVVLVGSDLLIIALGFGAAGLLPGLNFMRLEFPGPLQVLTVAVRRMRELPPALAALPLGLLFGFLPCGFLYAMAITAAQSADPLHGALILAAFSLGTLPALFLFGSAAHLLGVRARTWMLRGAGMVIALMGVYNLVRHVRILWL
jgi:uncharacterized protein